MLDQKISKILACCLQYIDIAKERFDGVSDNVPANIFIYVVKIAGEIVGMFNLYDRDSARKLEVNEAEDFQHVKDSASVAIVDAVKAECGIDLMFVDVERMLSCLCDNVYVSFVKRLEGNNKSSLSDDSMPGSGCEEDLHEYNMMAVMKDGSSQSLDNPEFIGEGLHSIDDAKQAALDAIEYIGSGRVDRIDIYYNGDLVQSISTPFQDDELESDSIVCD